MGGGGGGVGALGSSGAASAGVKQAFSLLLAARAMLQHQIKPSFVSHSSPSPLLRGQRIHSIYTEGLFIQFVSQDTIMSDTTERSEHVLFLQVCLPSAGASVSAAGAASPSAGAAAAIIEY